ncbi:hypothetical protein [Deinococcus sonorensis]|uniref:Uncharacterized protein n=2 Tax=Deinococcus sonorensis TaxID=309891 RepID=A0AAU7U4E2_9DEIO
MMALLLGVIALMAVLTLTFLHAHSRPRRCRPLTAAERHQLSGLMRAGRPDEAAQECHWMTGAPLPQARQTVEALVEAPGGPAAMPPGWSGAVADAAPGRVAAG